MYPITKRLPCSVCGFDSFSRSGWFLVVENRWLDRLTILTWHPSLASQKSFLSVCGRQHLKVLIAYWLEQANLRLLFSADEPSPGSSNCCCSDDLFQSGTGAMLAGELSVYRDEYSQVWKGSSATLESIIDALAPPDIDAPTVPDHRPQSVTRDFQVFHSPHKPPYEFAPFTEALADLS